LNLEFELKEKSAVRNAMSYNVAVSTSPVPAEDDTASDGLDSLIDEQVAPPPFFRELHDALTARDPCICTLLQSAKTSRALSAIAHLPTGNEERSPYGLHQQAPSTETGSSPTLLIIAVTYAERRIGTKRISTR